MLNPFFWAPNHYQVRFQSMMRKFSCPSLLKTIDNLYQEPKKSSIKLRIASMKVFFIKVEQEFYAFPFVFEFLVLRLADPVLFMIFL